MWKNGSFDFYFLLEISSYFFPRTHGQSHASGLSERISIHTEENVLENAPVIKILTEL